MPTPAPLSDPLPPPQVFLDTLTALGCPANVSDQAPSAQATLHLARMLVALAERHAVAAELACGVDGLDGHGVEEHQGAYDTATVRAAFERLALVHWRARRLAATVSTLREAMLSPDADDDDAGNSMGLMWDLAEHTTIAADAVIAVMARLVTPPAEATAAGVQRLDAATAGGRSRARRGGCRAAEVVFRRESPAGAPIV